MFTKNKIFIVLFVVSIFFLTSLLSVGAMEYNEAPELKSQVETGDLPPVEDRIPEEPLVVEPLEDIGNYGGDWRAAMIGGHGRGVIYKKTDYVQLVRWTPEWEGVVPDIAESYEVNEDSSEYTFYLREGMKWSDGEPFDADDILFWYEDILMNEDLTPGSPSQWLRAGGETVEVVKVDDYTVKFKFAEPNGLFLQELAGPAGMEPTGYAKHFFTQYHPNYTDEEKLDEMVEEEGLETWVDVFQSKGGAPYGSGRYQSSAAPRLGPWILTKAPGEGTNRAIAERNPYFFKVDPEGNQLPYINRVLFEILSDREMLVMNIINGDIDWKSYHVFDPDDRAVYMENREEGNYELFTTTPTNTNVFNLCFNLNHPESWIREVFQNKDFRIGMSHAIDRQEIIEIAYKGRGEPHQSAPRPTSKFYHERLAKQYTEYDVDLANEYLDDAGFSEKNDEGIRLTSEGNPLSFTMLLDGNHAPYPTIGELITGYWEEVGVDINLKLVDRDLWEQRFRTNYSYDISAHSYGGGAGVEVLMDPRYYFPTHGSSAYAGKWAHWYNDPDHEMAEEPIEPAKKQMELYDSLKRTGDPEKQEELMNEILDIAAEQFYLLGITTGPNQFGIVKTNMKNTPDEMPYSWRYPHPGPTNPETYSYED